MPGPQRHSGAGRMTVSGTRSGWPRPLRNPYGTGIAAPPEIPAQRRTGRVNPDALSCVLLQRELISAEFCHRIALCYAPGLLGWQIGG